VRAPSVISLIFLLTASFAGQAAARLPDTTLTYAVVDSTELKLDFHYAQPFSDSVLRPLIVWIHGGGWRGGSRADESPATPWADSGFHVASIDYRLSQQAMWPAQIHDAKAAVRWLRAHAGFFAIDTSNIVAWGASAGGHLASLLGLTQRADGLDGVVGEHPGAASNVRAVVDYYGASNFLEPIPARWTRWSAVGQLLGCAVPTCPDRARGASPVEYATPDDSPFLIVHGLSDSIVPFTQGVALDSALRGAGVPVRFVPVEAGHGGPVFSADSTYAHVRTFFDTVLITRAAPAAPLLPPPPTLQPPRR
jgi:acetyl esterase/lipase